jgi:hypothetical protein
VDDGGGVAVEAAGAEAGTVTAVIAAVEAAETAAGNRAINLRNLCIEPGSIFRSPFFLQFCRNPINLRKIFIPGGKCMNGNYRPMQFTQNRLRCLLSTIWRRYFRPYQNEPMVP